MSYYQSMNHHNMPDQNQFHFTQQPVFNPPNLPSNRFIYVKSNLVNSALTNPYPKPKVLVNPHFKKKVYVNPQFKPPETHISPPKPKIHVNPNMLKNFAKSVNTVPKEAPKPVLVNKPTTVISTRNKLVRIPCNSSEDVVRKRRNSLHSKYKIVRTGAKSSLISRFKLDKRQDKNVIKPNVRSVKKRYVYVNRFLSINIMAKNVLLKKNSNLCKPGFVNINGILYKKSPNSLKKASDSSLLSKSKTSIKKVPEYPLKSSSKYKIVRKDGKTKQQTPPNPRRSLVKRYKLIRSKKIVTNKPTPSKLRICNIPCPIFRKYGKCPRKAAGTCFKLHNPDQIVLCTRFLQGACHNDKCLLSHKVSPEKMPTCKYFLDGMCSKDNCPYLHVKISPKADICRDFLEGYCKKGAECVKRHQFLCPEFEKTKKCPKRRCPYPHGNTVRKNNYVLNRLAKKCSSKKDKKKKIVKIENVKVVAKDLPENNRYYKDLTKDGSTEVKSVTCGEEAVIKTVSKDRPKLGDLPAFIPFFDAS